STGAIVVVEPAVKDGILVPERFAPDGKALLLLARNPGGFVQMAVLELAPSRAEGKPPRPVQPPTFFGPGDWDVTEARWTRDGIYFLRNEGGATSLKFMASPKDE